MVQLAAFDAWIGMAQSRQLCRKVMNKILQRYLKAGLAAAWESGREFMTGTDEETLQHTLASERRHRSELSMQLATEQQRTKALGRASNETALGLRDAHARYDREAKLRAALEMEASQHRESLLASNSRDVEARSELTTQLETVEQELARCKSKLSAALAQTAKDAEKSKQQLQRYRGARADATAATRRATELQGQLETCEHRHQQALKDLTVLNLSKEGVSGGEGDAAVRLEKDLLDVALNAKKQAMEQLQLDQKTMTAKISMLVSSIHEDRAKMEQVQEERDELRTAHASLERENDRLQGMEDELAQCRSALVECERDVGVGRTEIDQLTAEFESRAKMLAEEIRILQAQLADSDNTVGLLERELRGGASPQNQRGDDDRGSKLLNGGGSGGSGGDDSGSVGGSGSGSGNQRRDRAGSSSRSGSGSGGGIGRAAVGPVSLDSWRFLRDMRKGDDGGRVGRNARPRSNTQGSSGSGGGSAPGDTGGYGTGMSPRSSGGKSMNSSRRATHGLEFLKREGFPAGLAEELMKTRTLCPLRYWLVDNSKCKWPHSFPYCKRTPPPP